MLRQPKQARLDLHSRDASLPHLGCKGLNGISEIWDLKQTKHPSLLPQSQKAATPTNGNWTKKPKKMRNCI